MRAMPKLRFDGGKRNTIRAGWDRLSKLPGGKRLFSRMAGMAAPYTGSIGAQVTELRIGHAEVKLADRRAVRNHLACVHAVALVNLGEMCGNMAVAYSLPDDARFIVAGIEADYLKKARGTLTATCDCPVPASSERREYKVLVSIRDAKGEEVTRVTLRTLVGPKKQAD
jgi:acyl-coenzyme A thioesterase PaaI-like protein